MYRHYQLTEETKKRRYNPDNNPHNLKVGDFILIKCVEDGNSVLPKKMDNKWYEITKISLHGIPQVLDRVWRSIRPENVQLIKRA